MYLANKLFLSLSFTFITARGLGSATALQWVRAEPDRQTHSCAIHSPKSANCNKFRPLAQVWSVAMKILVFDIQMS